MTRIIYLPDENSVTVLDSEDSPQAVSRLVQSGQWQPPAPHSPPPTRRPLHALCLGRVVIVSARPFAPPPDAPAVGPQHPPALSLRQRQILGALVEGQTSLQIALRLGVSRRTVDAHVITLKQRLNAETRSQIIARAAALGLLDQAQ